MTKTQFKKSWKDPFPAFWELLRETGVKWNNDNASRLSAALAYYTIFSLAPLLILAIAIAGLFFGNGAARSEVLDQLQTIIGPVGTQYIDNLIDLAQKPSATLLASLIGFATLLAGSTSTFVELQEALNTIWKTKPGGSGLEYFLRMRLLSFLIILAMGVVLLMLLVLSTVLAVISKYLSGIVPVYFTLLTWTNWVLSFGITAVFFAAIYKILPDTRVKWKDVWMGAVIASLLFSVGRYFIGLYLRHSSLSSLYGAAGSFVIVLLWIYYSAQILFFGAEFTEVYSRRRKREGC